MLKRLHDLASSRSFVPFLEKCQSQGYQINLVYLWLENADLAVGRVRERVAAGGHDIPEIVVRRRYEAGRRNFHLLYLPLAENVE